MLEHLLDANPDAYLPPPLADATTGFTQHADASPAAELDAKFNTVGFLDAVGALPDDQITATAQTDTAREAFAAMTSGAPVDMQKAALATVNVPAAVRELVGMLTAYDWAFVEQAKELRGYTVAKITEETTHPDARIRLKALELLGKVTEVALFTERTEVKQVGMSDSELDEELKARIDKYMRVEKEVQDSVVAVQTQDSTSTTEETGP